MADPEENSSTEFEVHVVDDPYKPEIDGWAYITQGDQEIFLSQEQAEWLAIELMRAYGLEWWPEPEVDVP